MNKQSRKHYKAPFGPEGMAAVRAEIAAQARREVRYVCGWGTCANFYDPETNRITWGFGRIGCPCDELPGWNARHPEMLAKPAWPTKAIGRNGSRVQRTKRRHRLVSADGKSMAWAVGMDEVTWRPEGDD